MHLSRLVREIINGLQAGEVPVEFLLLAKYVDRHGQPRTVQATDLPHFLNAPLPPGATEARVILDVRRIRMTMETAATKFFEDLDGRIVALTSRDQREGDAG